MTLKSLLTLAAAIIPLKAVIYCDGDGYRYDLQEPFWETADPQEIPHIEWSTYIVKFTTWQEAEKTLKKGNSDATEGHTGGRLEDEGYRWTIEYATNCKRGMM